MRAFVLMFAGVTALGVCAAQAATLTFTKIASSTDGVFTSFTPAPSINNSGVVAFSANDVAGGSSINFGAGGAVTEIARTGPAFGLLGGSPKINDQNAIAFLGRGPSSGAPLSVFVYSGGASAPVNGSRQLTAGFNHPFSINDAGAVAFLGGSALDRFVTIAAGGATTDIADATGEFTLFRGVSINNDMDVAFSTAGDNASEAEFDQGIYLASNGQLTEIAHTSGVYAQMGGNPSINDLDQIVFGATLDDGSNWLFLHSGGVTTPIFGGGDLAVSFLPALNNRGDVLFTASSPDVAGSIMLYSAGAVTTLLTLGDVVDGRIVQNFSFGPGSLNDNGEFAFFVFFSDQTRAIYRASIDLPAEVPLPAAAPMFVMAMSLLAVFSRRSKRKIATGLR